MATLRVTYSRASELRQDIEGQLDHGGILVRAGDTGDLTLHQPALLEIVAPDGRCVRGEGAILHVQPGQGVAVSFPAESLAALRAIAAGLPADPPGAPTARHERVAAGPALEVPAPRPSAPTPPAAENDASENDAAPPGDQRGETLTSADKIHLALHGTKDERTAILRDRHRMLHAYVLRNPQITFEEVLAVAKNPLSTPELLVQIAERKEWCQKPALALALCRNPKTPSGAGLRALAYVAPADLRQMAKGVNTPPHIVTAARKKVVK